MGVTSKKKINLKSRNDDRQIFMCELKNNVGWYPKLTFICICTLYLVPVSVPVPDPVSVPCTLYLDLTLDLTLNLTLYLTLYLYMYLSHQPAHEPCTGIETRMCSRNISLQVH